MIDATRTTQGAWEVSALVRDGREVFLDHCQFFDYTKREAIKLFKERVADKGYTLVK